MDNQPHPTDERQPSADNAVGPPPTPTTPLTQGGSQPAPPPAVGQVPHEDAPHAVTLKGAPHTSKKSKLIAFFALTLVLVLGGAGFAAYTMFVEPQMKVANALSNLQDLESVKIDFEVESSEQQDVAITGSVTPNLTAEQLALSLNLDLQIIAPTLDAQLIDGVFYVRLSNIDGAEALIAPFLGGFVSGFTGQDSLDAAQSEELNELSNLVGSLVQQVNNQWIEIDESLIEDTGVDVTALIREAQTKLQGVENITDGFEIVEMLDNEDVNGVNALRAKIALQPENLKAIFSQALVGLKVGDQVLEAADVEDAFDEMFEDYDATTDVFDVWVDPSSEQLIRISYSETDEDVTNSLQLDMSQHNAVALLTAPEDTISVLELYSLVEQAFGAPQIGDVLGEITL